jgi:cytidine deaminase
MMYINTMNDFTILNDSSELDETGLKLLNHAIDALQHSYSPYSNFRVGTAILLEDGTIVNGANQENAAYPSCMCAERVALSTVASQHPGKKIKALLVLAKANNSSELSPASSCGPCRQVMLEFEERQAKPFQVVMQIDDHRWVVAKSAASLLPFSFSSTSLGVRNP